jgi:tetratricopeptide (TPR) repeat protein
MHLANRRYQNYITVSDREDPSLKEVYSEYSVNILASMEDSPSLILSMTHIRTESETESFAINGIITEDTAVFMANVIFYQWSSFHGFLQTTMGDPPLYVDEITASSVAATLLPDMPAMIVPTSMAVKPNGNILVGFSMICVEFDKTFRIIDQPGKNLYDSGNYTYASGIAVTPGATVFFKPSMGREMYRISGGSSQVEKIRTGVDLFGPFGALPDGSIVLVDIQKRRAYRIWGRKRSELDLFPGPYSYISSLAVGPEGNIWIHDAAERRIRIYTSNGEFIDSIIPLIDPSIGSNPLSLGVYRDGSFVLYYSGGHLQGFHRDGRPLWKLTKLDVVPKEELPQIGYIAIDSAHGFIYLVDQMGGRIIKLLDSHYGKKFNIKNDFDEQITKLNAKQWRNMDDPSPTVKKAQLYQKSGALEMAKLQWEKVLEYSPLNNDAFKQLEELEISIMRENARTMKKKTLDVLESIGPESARRYYSSTLQLYEKILSISPQEKGIKEEIESLKRQFRVKESDGVSARPNITITNIKVQNIFPSLMQYYRSHPVGRITVLNNLNGEVKNLKTTIYIKKYMDFPSETEIVRSLKPGEKTYIDLYLYLNEDVFDIQETLPVQAKIELTYLFEDSPRKQSKYMNLTIFRRTALSWEDSGRITTFIMPNEGIVTEFSHRVSGNLSIGKNFRFPARFFRAVRICDALGVFDVAYIEDPESPISRVLGKKEIVDTVRFPRTTLLIRSGDCDDTTALLGSLLESAGISTAIMTSPGHVFLAFDTGEAANYEWMYRTSGLQIIKNNGTIWIPIETTTLQKGFMASWREASILVERYTKSGEIEFLTTEKEREQYPPLPLPGSSFTVVEPSSEDIDRMFQSTVTKIETSLYQKLGSDLQEHYEKKDGQENLILRNRLGILHARFGRDDRAESVFMRSMERYPEYIPPYINYANLKLLNNDIDAAITVLKNALRQDQESTHIHLLLARCFYLKGDRESVVKHYSILKKKSPAIATRYKYLLAPTTTRAGTDLFQNEIIWSAE